MSLPQCRVANAQHIGAREAQEDSFRFSDLEDGAFIAHAGVLAVVADGMGGMTAGGAMSEAAVRGFVSAYSQKHPQEPIPIALERALQFANAQVLTAAAERSVAGSAGTTLAAVVLHQELAYWISVGDSRIYLVRNGKASRMTIDHTRATDLKAQVIAGNLDAAQVALSPDREALTSYLGSPELEKIDRNVRPLALSGDECALLCTDGLYATLRDQEIGSYVTSDLQVSAISLMNAVLDRRVNGQDNVTVMLISPNKREKPSNTADGGRRQRILLLTVGVIVSALALINLILLWRR